ncbi:MAG: hypothetical protein Q8P70_01980, partial [bacterium]|nr:hypothetical protein [bacterium]
GLWPDLPPLFTGRPNEQGKGGAMIMPQECSLVCFDCKQNVVYVVGKYKCPLCDRTIVDREIESLVVALNLADILTERSCEGHNGDDGLFSFPWVVIAPVQDHDKVLNNVKILLFHYNKTIEEQNQWEVQCLYREDRHWIVPVGKNDRRLSEMQASARLLAKFIEKQATFCLQGTHE